MCNSLTNCWSCIISLLVASLEKLFFKKIINHRNKYTLIHIFLDFIRQILTFYYHTLHILMTAIILPFFFATLGFFYFLFFSYTSNNKIMLFYNCIKIFGELLKSLEFWFLLSYHHIDIIHQNKFIITNIWVD